MTVAIRSLLLASAMMAAAAGGGARAQTTTPRGYAVQSHTPEGFRLPAGPGCSGEIARWQAVQANDYAGGNVSLTVYNEIQTEIDRAATLCGAGQDAQARKIVADSKRRHGYSQ